MTSTLVDEYPSFFRQFLFFSMDVSLIVVNYLALIRLIVVSFFRIFDCVLPGWDPGLDQHTPSLRCMLRRQPKPPPRDYHWKCCQKRYNPQKARMRVYPFWLCHFQHQPHDIVPEDNRPESAMYLLLSVFWKDVGVERWCHRWARLLATTPIVLVINTYRFCVRHLRATSVFRAYAGTAREAIDFSHSIRFNTDS